LAQLGAVPLYIGARLGSVATAEGEAIEVEVTFETMPSVLFDAVAVPDGREAINVLSSLGDAAKFLDDQYRHAKPMLLLGSAVTLLESAGISPTLPSGGPDPGLIVANKADATHVFTRFRNAIARHRHYERGMDPGHSLA
jgi:catalase